LHVDGTSLITGNSIFNANVGIGVTSPSQKLDVSGNGKFSGDLFVNNTHKVASLSQNQTFTGIQTFNNDVNFSDNINFNGDVNFSGNSYFLVDGPKFFEIRNEGIYTRLQVGVSQMDRSFHRAAKTGDIVLRRLGQEGDNKKFIISSSYLPNTFPAQAVGITGADDESAA
jgi:hypothetical protein